MAESTSTRRRFINWLLGTSVGALGVMVFGPVVAFLTPPKRTEATTNEVEAGPINDPAFLEKGYKIVSFGADPVIVVRVGHEERPVVPRDLLDRRHGRSRRIGHDATSVAAGSAKPAKDRSRPGRWSTLWRRK